ncbi:MAG: response regulator [Spirochaetes bacterium]|nr:response regulator [Spirochaetota bacterium]
MIKILVVDDEKMIREGIVMTMPWNEMGMEVIGSAGDGLKALEMIREFKPHIVLTDIRMPKMDGIELLRAGKALIPSTRFVILSGYDDFAYAQQALKYGAADYLLKPLSEDELKKILTKLKRDLENEINSCFQQNTTRKLIEKELEQFYLAVRIGDKQNALLRLGDMFRNRAFDMPTLEQYREIIIEIMYSLLNISGKAPFNLSEKVLLDRLALEDLLVGYTNVAELKDWMYRFVENLMDRLREHREGNYQPMIKKALEFVEARFDEDISIEEVASSIFLSPNYFSHIFKKARGECFTDYLNRVRIEEAKKILSEGAYKVYEVAEMVGYHDYKYFSSVFKKYVGVPPIRFKGDSDQE